MSTTIELKQAVEQKLADRGFKLDQSARNGRYLIADALTCREVRHPVVMPSDPEPFAVGEPYSRHILGLEDVERWIAEYDRRARLLS